jgi:hypothetical protein
VSWQHAAAGLAGKKCMVWVHVTLSPYHQAKRLPARPCLQHENSNAVLAAKDRQHNHFKWAEFLAPIMALTP